MTSVTGAAREEERAARARLRQMERMRRSAERSRARERESKLRMVIREELARRPSCTCPITPSSTMAEIMAMGSGCTAGSHGHGGYVCPCLDAIRRRMGR